MNSKSNKGITAACILLLLASLSAPYIFKNETRYVNEYKKGKAEQSYATGKTDTVIHAFKKERANILLPSFTDTAGIKTYAGTARDTGLSFQYKIKIDPLTDSVKFDYSLEVRSVHLFRTDTLKTVRADTVIVYPANQGETISLCSLGIGVLIGVIISAVIIVSAG